MLRVFKVMVLLAVFTAAAITIQPTPAFADGPAMDEALPASGGEAETMDTGGDSGENGEGDPDSVGGGYGALEDDFTGLFGGQSGLIPDGLTLEEFIYLILTQFMPMP